jgi:hypothetical protein
MSGELTPTNPQQLAPLPFGQGRGLSAHVNAGAVAVEQERAIAEAQGQLILAKKFPRSMAAAMSELLDSCKSPDFAAKAFYSVPNRGSGPSIRFAEEVARVYGNFQYGHRELSRSEGQSEIEVFAWDMEKNNRSIRQITVPHVVDTKHGPKVLKDQADINNLIANVASKQMRGRIMALLPKSLVEAGIAECKKTVTGDNTVPIAVRVTRMTEAFKANFNVGPQLLEAYLGHPLDTVTVDELTDLLGVFNAIKEGAKASEYFGAAEAAEASAKTAETIAKAGERKPAATKAKANQATAPDTAQPAQAEPEKQAAPAQQVSNPVQKPDNPVKAETAAPQVSTDPQQDAAENQDQEGDVF